MADNGGTVGSAEYELDLDTSKFKAKADEASAYLKTVFAVAAGIELQKVAHEIEDVAKEVADLTIEFGHSIVNIANQADITEEAARGIGEAMLEMSRDTLFGAETLVNALARTGARIETLTGQQLDLAQSTLFMKAATDLATASQQDLGAASNSLISVMLAYQIPLEKASDTSDKLFNISRLTGVGFDTLTLAADRLKERMGDLAPNLGEMGALIAELNAQGLTGNRGLLVFVSGLNSITDQSKDVNNELNRLGVGVFDQEGKFVGIRSVIDQLSHAYAGMTDQQKKASASILFGTSAANGFIGLINAGLPTLDGFQERVDKSGTSAEGAARHVDDLKGQLEIFKNNMEATAIEMGEKLEPAALKLLETLNPLVTAFTENEDAMNAVAIIAGGILVAALLVLTVAAWNAVAGFVALFIAENAALLGLPVAIAVAIAAIMLLIQHWQDLKDNWKEVVEYIAIAAIPMFGPIFMALDVLRNHWQGVFDVLPEPVQDFVTRVAGLIDTMTGAAVTSVEWMANQILGIFSDLVNAIGSFIQQVRDMAPSGSGNFLDALGFSKDNADALKNFNPQVDLGGGTDFQGAIERHVQSVANQAAADWANSNSIANARPKEEGAPEHTGGGEPVVPPFTPDKEKKAKELSEAEKALLALAAAFEKFHAATGGTIEDFRAVAIYFDDARKQSEKLTDAIVAYKVATIEASDAEFQSVAVLLKITEDKVDLLQREAAAQRALRVATFEAADANYQLRLTFVELQEEAIRTGHSVQQVVEDMFQGILNNAESTLNQILGGPTREGTELQLKIDKLQRDADILKREGADSSHLNNIDPVTGKPIPGKPPPTAADKELKMLEDRIKGYQNEQKVRQDEINIMKDEAILANKQLQTDQGLVNAHVFLTAVISNLSQKVMDLDKAMGGLIGKILGAGDLGGIPKLAGGMAYVPAPMVVQVDPGEAVLTAEENRAYRQGSFQSRPAAPVNATFVIQERDDAAILRKITDAGAEALRAARRSGSNQPTGSGRR